MTSQPLANSDRGVMRIIGIAELMHLPRLSPSSLAHYAILYLPSLPNLSKAVAPSSFIPVATPRLLSVAFFFHLLLSDACFSFSRIKTPLPAPVFEILARFPKPCHNTSLQWNWGMFVPVSLPFSCADMSGTHPEAVPAGHSCETVSLTLKPLQFQNLRLPQYLWTFAAAGCFLPQLKLKNKTPLCSFH